MPEPSGRCWLRSPASPDAPCCLLPAAWLQVKQSGAGHQATLVFRQSTAYLEPLYDRLKQRQLPEELKVGGGGVGSQPGDTAGAHRGPTVAVLMLRGCLCFQPRLHG